MRKAFNVDKQPGEVPALWDAVYKVAVIGKDFVSAFIPWWNDQRPDQRSIIFQPWLTATVNVFDNASAFLYMLQNLTGPQWRNGNPIIVDNFETPAGNRFNLDNMNTFKVYIRDNYDMQGEKLLLRMNVKTWQAWCTSAPVITQGLLEVFDILLSQPGASRPADLQFVGTPLWWEYESWGKYKNDPTGEWPVTPPVDPPVIPPPATGKKRYNIVIGGQIIGYTEEQ